MKKILFIGAGNMASAICAGILKSNLVPASSVLLYDKNSLQYSKFDNRCIVANNLSDGIKMADYIFISVKPQNVKELLNEIKDVNYKEKTFISICAGITINSIEKVLTCARIVRVMPNTPLLIGMGTTALCRNNNVADADFTFVEKIFKSAGDTILVEEKDINAITATTGSSPAYVYLFIKSIAESAEKLGFNSDRTVELVCKTLIGSANMILSGDKTIDEQISMVKSPNGTTERALNVFEANNFSKIIYDAMKACEVRAKELSDLND
ncbi:MAG: pyrroline-5-carboxylate reductase [Clostridia bacterium]|nr:pyrroline-5-carboxylate reductase [Clostridia bacterium]